MAGLVACSGCGSPWVYNYVDAGNLAKESEKPILVFYRDYLDPASGQMWETLRSPKIQAVTRKMVLCSLVTEYDPNRRYVLQYGVTGVPALIVVHPDGTYHSRVGVAGENEIISFLNGAQPPGLQPKVDIQVTRPPDDYLLRGESNYERAVERANRQNRKLLIVYKWWLDGDSTELVRRMMLPEVASRCNEMVACVLDWDYVPNRSHVARYGVTRFPAMIVVSQDDTYRAREGLASTEEIVRFLSPAAERAGTEGTASAYAWYLDYARAREAAVRSNRGLFIFGFSTYSPDSARMSRLLDTQAVSDLFRDTVNCRLDWADARSRELLSEFNVLRAPGFVAVRPDGSFQTHVGPITIEDLRRLRRFLGG